MIRVNRRGHWYILMEKCLDMFCKDARPAYLGWFVIEPINRIGNAWTKWSAKEHHLTISCSIKTISPSSSLQYHSHSPPKLLRSANPPMDPVEQAPLLAPWYFLQSRRRHWHKRGSCGCNFGDCLGFNWCSRLEWSRQITYMEKYCQQNGRWQSEKHAQSTLSRLEFRRRGWACGLLWSYTPRFGGNASTSGRAQHPNFGSGCRPWSFGFRIVPRRIQCRR